MRVLYTSHFGGLGGAERSLLELMVAVRGRGVEPCLLCPGGPLQQAAARALIPVATWPAQRWSPRKPLRAAIGLANTAPTVANAVRRFRPDVVHANTTTSLLAMCPIAPWLGQPIIWHWRDFETRPRLARFLARFCSVAISISSAIAEHATAVLRTSGCPVVLVRNGIADTPTAWDDDAEVRRAFKVPNDVPLVVMAGQSVPRKGHAVLLAALRHLARQRRDLHALLVCSEFDDRARAHTRRLRELAGASLRVEIVGERPRLGSLLRAADVVAVPSLREPFGRIAVEAMLAERPVVASAVDGLVEIVTHQETGLLVPPGAPEALAGAIDRVLAAPDAWRAKGRQARAHAQHQFSIGRVASETTALYRRFA